MIGRVSAFAALCLPALASKAVEKYPAVLHDTTNHTLSPQLRAVQFIGHRGANEGIPENTVAAFRHAIVNRMDCVELDVRLTSDGEVVVFHDQTMARMTSGKVVKGVEETAFKDLPVLKPQDKRQVTAGDEETHRIPRFKEVLTLLDENPNLCMIVEFKEDSNETIRQVHTLIQAYRGRIIWFSLKGPINVKLRQYDPAIPTIAGAIECLKYAGLYYIGLLPFTSLPFAVFGISLQEVTLQRVREEPALSAVPDTIKRALAWVLQGSPPWLLDCPGLFTHLQKRGVPTSFLGCNEDWHVERARELGADSVLTDRPHWLKTAHLDKGMQLHHQSAAEKVRSSNSDTNS